MKSATVGVRSEAILKYYSEFIDESRSENQIEYFNQYLYFFSITMRDCVIGEIYIKSLNMYLKNYSKNLLIKIKMQKM